MEDHIKYRLERAKTTLDDAIFLFEKESWNSSINRLYYAAFYAAIALMLHHGIAVKSHNGVKQKIGQLVNSGVLKKEHSKTFSLLSDFRHKGDYDDLFDFDSSLVSPLIQPVKDFISEVENLLR